MRVFQASIEIRLRPSKRRGENNEVSDAHKGKRRRIEKEKENAEDGEDSDSERNKGRLSITDISIRVN